jgi:hypothetical protein
MMDSRSSLSIVFLSWVIRVPELLQPLSELEVVLHSTPDPVSYISLHDLVERY